MNKSVCYQCVNLKMEGGAAPPNWVAGKFYTCSKGRYALGKTYKQWFAWSGILRPNKTVKMAQTDCPMFEARK